jgi:hypothetical protein
MGVNRYSAEYQRYRDCHAITDARTGYEMLVYSPVRSAALHNRVAFMARLGGSEQPIPITNRNVEQYRHELPGLPVNPALRYTEVGGGLGGLAEHVVRHPGHTGKRPLIIDPVDYGAMNGLMDYALDHAAKLDLPQQSQARILELRIRSDVIRDDTRVRLLNMTLAEAYERHPDIRGRSDVVVELCGASLYPDVEGHDKLEIVEASRRNYVRYVTMLKRGRDGEPKGTVCMMTSRGTHVTHYGVSR